MGLHQSKDEQLYQEVSKGNIEGIKALRSQGAGLEWVDGEGKTPLILACMNPGLYNTAKTLIELGANVNAYRTGRLAGTPLHHAAERGLGQTVELLLLHGANALILNYNCQSPLDVARTRGYNNVVRRIEGHLCLFAGWLRELFGPGFLDHLAPQLLSRKVWVVVLPCGSRNLRKPFKLELAIYAGTQDAQPRTIIPLWKANLGGPNFDQSDPVAIISDVSRISRRWKRRRCIRSSQEAGGRIKLAPVEDSEKQQLQRFCNACKGIPQVMHSIFPFNDRAPGVLATAPPSEDELQLVMAINASRQFAERERLASHDHSSTSSSSSTNSPSYDKCHTIESSTSHNPSGSRDKVLQNISGASPAQHLRSPNNIPSTVLIPSAPASDIVMDNGPIHYPSIDSTSVDLSVGGASGATFEKKDDGSATSCTICLDAALEGACIPCGHMAGCMSCLNEIKAKKWGCPVCRANIDQVVRIYSV